MSQADLSVDVLVVGLGPGGGSAALNCAKEGLKVLGVDKTRELGHPVQCAEFVPNPMGKYTKGEGILAQRITGMKSVLPSGDVKESEFPGLMIDRAAFDAQFSIQAREEGADIRTSTMLMALDADAHIATLRGPIASAAKGGDNGNDEQAEYTVQYKVMIAADGPHSKAAQDLGLPELDIVYTRQYTVPLLVPYEDTDIWLNDDFPGGYGWLFPKDDIANVGMGADKAFETNLKEPLDKLLAHLVEKGIVGEQISYRTGGAIPVGGLRDTAVVKDVILIGDAVGLTHPITGAGISAAVISGEYAADAAIAHLEGDDEAYEDYEDEIRTQFEPTLTRAVARRQLLKQYWRTEAAHNDDNMRVGWIAFDEYFDDQAG